MKFSPVWSRAVLVLPLSLLALSGSAHAMRAPVAITPTRVVDGHTIVPPVANEGNAIPFYPITHRRVGVEGWVFINFVVDADGRVTNAEVDSSTSTDFEKPTLDAVRQWSYRPGTRDGVPVAMAVRVPVDFTLEPAGAPRR